MRLSHSYLRSACEADGQPGQLCPKSAKNRWTGRLNLSGAAASAVICSKRAAEDANCSQYHLCHSLVLARPSKCPKAAVFPRCSAQECGGRCVFLSASLVWRPRQTGGLPEPSKDSMIGRSCIALSLFAAILVSAGAARAQNCTSADFGAVVDQTAQALRDLNVSGSRRYQAKVASLREKNGLSDADVEARRPVSTMRRLMASITTSRAWCRRWMCSARHRHRRSPATSSTS